MNRKLPCRLAPQEAKSNNDSIANTAVSFQTSAPVGQADAGAHGRLALASGSFSPSNKAGGLIQKLPVASPPGLPTQYPSPGGGDTIYDTITIPMPFVPALEVLCIQPN